MENRIAQDLRILKKAKRHVSFITTFMFLLLILYFVSLFYINQQVDFLTVSVSFKNTFYLLAAIEILIFVFLNSLIMKGRKIARVLYWLVFLLEISVFYFPMSEISTDRENFLTYIALMLLMLLKLSILARFGSYLKHNKYCKILFDHVLEVSEGEENYIEPEPSKQRKLEIPEEKQRKRVLKGEDLDNDDYDTSEFKTEKIKYKKPKEETIVIDVIEEFTFPQLAIKLAAVVYGSLAGFPILVTLLSEFLCSTDGKVVFATKDIFILCILSAVLWTFAVLFLYYDHPKSKLLCNLCILGEIVGLLFYVPKFLGYMNNTEVEFTFRVYIIFIVINLIRYILILIIIKPIYSAVDEIEEEQTK